MKINRIFFLMIFLVSVMDAYSADKEFAGLNFGVGISLSHDLGDHDRINSASIVNGVVRIDDEQNDIARIMLESHYFFTP